MAELNTGDGGGKKGSKKVHDQNYFRRQIRFKKPVV